MTSKKQIAEIILASFTAIFLAAFIRLFFFDTYIVTNKSMEPTFFEGDEILLLKKKRCKCVRPPFLLLILASLV